jgi:hypothetical protein
MMAEKTGTLLSHTVVKPDACNVVGGIVRRLKAIQNPQGKSKGRCDFCHLFPDNTSYISPHR